MMTQTIRTNFLLNKNQKKLYDRIVDQMGEKIEILGAHENRWASELADKNLIQVEGSDNNITYAYIPMYTFVRKLWDGTYGEGMSKNYTEEIVKAPDLITALGNYNSNILGVEFSGISESINPITPNK